MPLLSTKLLPQDRLVWQVERQKGYSHYINTLAVIDEVSFPERTETSNVAAPPPQVQVKHRANENPS